MLHCRSFSTTGRYVWTLSCQVVTRIILRTLIPLSGLRARTAAGSLLFHRFVYLQDKGRRNNLLFQPSYLLTFSPLTTTWINLMLVSNSNWTSGTAVCWCSLRLGWSRRSPTRGLHRRDSTYTAKTGQLIQASGGVCVMVNFLWATDVAVLAPH